MYAARSSGICNPQNFDLCSKYDILEKQSHIWLQNGKKARKNRNHAGKKKRAVALFVIVLICLCGWWAVRKEGLLDEIYSYGLANSSYAPFLSWLHGGEQVANGKLPEAVFTQSEFLNYVAPQGSTRFDYASVYYNQTQDVHPPLFYFLLHTVCSLFPGSFTKWTGLGMNFVLLGGTLATQEFEQIFVLKK